MLSVIMLNGTYKPFMLSIVVLSVVAPSWQHESKNYTKSSFINVVPEPKK
jgi:hypothetical protein